MYLLFVLGHGLLHYKGYIYGLNYCQGGALSLRRVQPFFPTFPLQPYTDIVPGSLHVGNFSPVYRGLYDYRDKTKTLAVGDEECRVSTIIKNGLSSI